ncbi:MAG: Flp family type IVb pilin [Alphaproteobacteria bacterium]|nr:Flp family type IVb pilin [Alphaproteobacteria bacterium]
MNAFRHFLRDRSGATAIEYTLIAAFIGLVLITALYVLGPTISVVFDQVGVGLAAGAP